MKTNKKNPDLFKNNDILSKKELFIIESIRAWRLDKDILPLFESNENVEIAWTVDWVYEVVESPEIYYVIVILSPDKKFGNYSAQI